MDEPVFTCTDFHFIILSQNLYLPILLCLFVCSSYFHLLFSNEGMRQSSRNSYKKCCLIRSLQWHYCIYKRINEWIINEENEKAWFICPVTVLHQVTVHSLSNLLSAFNIFMTCASAADSEGGHFSAYLWDARGFSCSIHVISKQEKKPISFKMPLFPFGNLQSLNIDAASVCDYHRACWHLRVMSDRRVTGTVRAARSAMSLLPLPMLQRKCPDVPPRGRSHK